MDDKSNSDKAKTESRREFLKTAGKFAVYTPPALMLMGKPGSEVFAESGGSVDEQQPTAQTASCSDGGLAEGAIAELMCKLGM